MNRSNTGSLELNCLRASKSALDEGLITAEDYEGVKASFLKAQQLRAGVEAGLIKEDDYSEAKKAFMGSFVTNLGNGSGSNTAGNPQSVPKPAPAAQTRPARLSQRGASTPSTPATTGNSNSNSGGGGGVAGLVSRMNASNSSNNRVPARQQSTQERPKIKVPEMGGSATENKTSMSGIKVHKDAINLYNYVKAKKAHKWMTYRLDTAGMEVVVADVGSSNSTYQEFIQAFPENECRYGVFDWEYINSEGEVFGKLLFLHWAPDSASVKNKMMYASTKDFFKGFMDGLAVELQATDQQELEEDVAFEAVKSTVVRK
eukprot:TRINITY_DN490_c0_g1_i1.p1 TRINITY_DN490_c0_g1~~TRINITY_DN490_c0_g1_i1.p1  ORF type:complete len:316 (+),score=46.12 TRINITY_DN490_c0_g1_i1:130-1077(+)